MVLSDLKFLKSIYFLKTVPSKILVLEEGPVSRFLLVKEALNKENIFEAGQRKKKNKINQPCVKDLSLHISNRCQSIRVQTLTMKWGSISKHP